MRLFLYSQPWILIGDEKYIERAIIKINHFCELSIDINDFPHSLYNLYNFINYSINNSQNNECISNLISLKNQLKNNSFSKQQYFSYQSDYKNFYLQGRESRHYEGSYFSYNKSMINGKFAYKLSVSKDLDTNKDRFDESFIAYKNSNTVFKIGRLSRWWSPSKETSLILSNTARPQVGISVSNYMPKKIENKYFKLFNNFSYTFFLNKLEEDRHISNTLLFGQRFSFKPHKSLDISLVRTAQFGGDGRPTDIKTIKNMLLGKDNTNRNLSFNDQPGNQIAGIDLTLNLLKKNNLTFYLQYLGEDGLDPIFKGSGAIFPSKRFHQFGFRYSDLLMQIPYEITFEKIDTFSGSPNVTYNHSLYRSGYRYFGIPIGANIDADSQNFIIAINAHINNQNRVKITLNDLDINSNTNSKNYLSANAMSNKLLTIKYEKYYKNLEFSLSYRLLDKSLIGVNKNHAFINLKYFF